MKNKAPYNSGREIFLFEAWQNRDLANKGK